MTDQKIQEAQTILRVTGEISRERLRQINEEGWSVEHDDSHDGGELSGAAAAYALYTANELHPNSQGDGFDSEHLPPGWCWDPAWFKPTTPRRNLVKAAALIVAEIERMDRKISEQTAKENLLFERALEWLKNENHTGENPSFSELKTNGMIFNDNEAADEIEMALTDAGEAAGYFVHPEDIVNASLAACDAFKANQ